MTEIAIAEVQSSAPPVAFFAKWADMTTWPEWNLDTEWVRLDGPFAAGATGTLKPKGGPKVPFVVATLNEREFVDVSRLLGARLTFAHEITPLAGGSRVRVRITMTGPLRTLWMLMLGNGLRASVQPDLERLAAAAERATAATA